MGQKNIVNPKEIPLIPWSGQSLCDDPENSDPTDQLCLFKTHIFCLKTFKYPLKCSTKTGLSSRHLGPIKNFIKPRSIQYEELVNILRYNIFFYKFYFLIFSALWSFSWS